LTGVKITIEVDNSYVPVMTRLTRNVVGMVEGGDPALKDTYVLFGAHLDHVGYAETARDVRGRVNNPIDADRIWNGADDDGTGTTAELAIAKAFATGPRPRRSVVFVWHSGEEANLYGSRYNADFPIVPLEKVQCQLNIDMIGRNRDNEPGQADSVFVIGADRISTDLHNLIVDTNAKLPDPLTLDYEYNDPSDPNSFYTRSDHFSYASKGVPIAFFFTGEHADYHANSDSVEKILFHKQARIAQLVYRVGFAVADSGQALRRDERGPRAGRGFSGKLD
jgi:Zn-dependent M28 family amino/carboxypeptidase